MLLGLALRFNLPIEWARYTAVGILAALDSLLGAYRAELEGHFDTRIFVSGFYTNFLLAAGLTFLGDRLGIVETITERAPTACQQAGSRNTQPARASSPDLRPR